MGIIEKIKANKLIDKPTEIQKICLNKLKSSPLPNPKSELWRLSNKSKFANVLDYSLNHRDQKFDIPFKIKSQNIIRLVIGEDSQILLEEENYSIKQLNKDNLDNYIKQKISCFDQNEHWSDLLNLCIK